MNAVEAMPLARYAIRGGREGRERLRVLSRVLQPVTGALLDRLPLLPGMACLDAGCGGGDVTLEIARRVGPHGRVLGIDLDPVKLQLARADAARLGHKRVTFRRGDVRAAGEGGFDFIYCRFVLSHLAEPAVVLASLSRRLRPGGLLAVEDIDLAGHFAHPPSAALKRFCELYDTVVRRGGGDPEIGPRLPLLIRRCGLVDSGVNLAQTVAMVGEAKRLPAITMQAIGPALVAQRLASASDVAATVQELEAYAANPDTLTGTPRIVQAWGRRPAV